MTRKEEREFLFNKTNGRCAYCGCELPKRWHADHMEPVVRKLVFHNDGSVTSSSDMWYPENDTIENKVASCPSCNIKKGNSCVEGFRNEIASRLEMLNQYAPYKLAKKFGQVKETPDPVVFYFEKITTDTTKEG